MVESWSRTRGYSGPNQELHQPLNHGYIASPKSSVQRSPITQPNSYRPPPLEVQTRAEMSAPTPTTSPIHPGTSPVNGRVNLLEDDDAFINVADALLSQHAAKKLTVEQSICSTLLPHERKAFMEALHFRTTRLPMFPEVGESSNCKLIREVDRIFGKALSDMATRFETAQPTSPRAQPAPSEIKSAYETISPQSQSHRSQVSRGNVPSFVNLPSTVREHNDSSSRNTPSHYTSTSQKQTAPYRVMSPQSGSVHREMSSPRHTDYERFSDPQLQQHHSFHPNPGSVSSQNMQQQYGPEMMYAQQQYSNLDMSAIHAAQMMSRQHQAYSSSPVYGHRRPTPTRISEQYVRQRSPNRRTVPTIEVDWNIAVAEPYSITADGTISQPRRSDIGQSVLQQQEATTLSPKKGLVPGPISPLSDEGRLPSPPKTQSVPISPKSPKSPNTDSKSPRPKPESTSGVQESTSAVADVTRSAELNEAGKEELPATVIKDSTGGTDAPLPDVKEATDEKMETPTKAISPPRMAIQDEMNPIEKTESLSAPVRIKPGGIYQVDIVRSKSVLLYNEAQTEFKNTQMIKELADEIERITQKLHTASNSDERSAYQQYLNELTVELSRWSSKSRFGNDLSERDARIHINIDRVVDQNRDIDSLFKDEKEPMDRPRQLELTSHTRQTSPQRTELSNKNPKNDRIAKWRMVNVFAPETLPGGFKFEARIDDHVFMATVPEGGVTKGEVFTSRMGDIYGESNSVSARVRTYMDMDAPPSRWRDGLFSCFRLGIAHPFLCNSIFCPHVALSQIMARIQLTGTGDRVVTLKSRTRIGTIICMACSVGLLHLMYASYFVVATPDEDTFMIATMPLVGLDVSLLIYFLYMVAQTRKIVRVEYDIPEHSCRGREDCCIAVFCTCCAIAQMGRHTADYETFLPYCCTDTGLAKHIEVKLPSEKIDYTDECESIP